MILGHAANQGPFHAAIDLFDNGVVLKRMCEVLDGADLNHPGSPARQASGDAAHGTTPCASGTQRCAV